MKIYRKVFRHRVGVMYLAVAGVIAVYALLAAPFYVWLRSHDLKNAYEAICLLDLSMLDEEDEEILQDIQANGLEFLITDGDFNIVYNGNIRESGQRIEKSIKGRQEDYQEEPVVIVRNYNGTRTIRLKALLQQGQDHYYLYIRKTIRALNQIIGYTVLYLAATAAALILLCRFLFAGQRAKGSLPQEREKPVRVGEQGQYDDMQNEFVANISHELKTPLSVISGQVEMLQNMGEEIDRDYYFASIREEIDKMSGMVSDLLDLTIMEHHMEQMEMSRVDASDLMQYMVLRYDALFKQNGVKVETQIAEGCFVRGNRMYLEQAVNNYIMNAFQHTPQGKRIRITLVREEQCARIGIYNEGSFIPEEDSGRIWQSFYMKARGINEETSKMSNAGLGLYTVKKIVEQHNGFCGVQNMEKGVEFWMRIPLFEYVDT